MFFFNCLVIKGQNLFCIIVCFTVNYFEDHIVLVFFKNVEYQHMLLIYISSFILFKVLQMCQIKML